jgi:hypothetical protein
MLSIWSLAFFAVSTTANAQLKETPPAADQPTVARQQIRTLLEKVDAGNRQQTVATLTGMLIRYRDTFDEELITAWQRDARANLPEVIESLADSRIASAIIEFSWHEQRRATFNPAYTPMLGGLMSRYSASAKPFLDDLLGLGTAARQAPDLSQPEAEAVCRILLDMPDTGTWKKSALQILPHYRQVAERLLAQDQDGGDPEKSIKAQFWLADLRAAATTPRSSGGAPPATSPPVKEKEKAKDGTVQLQAANTLSNSASSGGTGHAPPQEPVPPEVELLAAPACNSADGTCTSRIPADTPADSTPSSMANEMVASHNMVRARVGTAPLTWSDHLAAVAQDWADRLLASGRVAQKLHHPDLRDDLHSHTPRLGENWLAIGGAATPAMVVNWWAGEARDYDYGSNSCRSVCGHYTQVVWKSTKAVGCGVARGGGSEIWVCEYSPQGNRFYISPWGTKISQKPY